MSKTVLITSITGFLGAQILDDAVKAGFSVVATVRDLAKGEAAIKQYTNASKQVSVVECRDLVTGDLSEALKGVDVVLHVASPYVIAGITK